MATSERPLQRQIPIVLQMPAVEHGPVTAEMVRQLRAIADEMRGYTERIEKAIAGEQLFYTEADLAGMFEISELTVKRIRRAGKIKFKRVAGKPVFTRRHLEEFLSS